MKRIITILVFTIFAASSLQAQKWDKIRIATEGAWAPFNYLDSDGKLAGFEVELVDEMCKAINAECELVSQDWDGIIPGLLARKYDAIVASMSITDERKQTISFSNPYYTTPARFVAEKGTLKDINKDTLRGKVIGVQSATIHENFMKGEYNNVVSELKRYSSIEEAYLDLKAGRLDAVFADSTAIDDGFLKKDNNSNKYEFVGPNFSEPKYFGNGVGVGIRQADTDLVAKFNEAIEAVYANGSFKKLNDKYFPYSIAIEN